MNIYSKGAQNEHRWIQDVESDTTVNLVQHADTALSASV